MREALHAALRSAARGDTRVEIVTQAAEAVAHDPWAVVTQAGALARAAWVSAPRDLGLTETLRVTSPGHKAAIAVVPAGAPYPRFDRSGRQRRGAYDTPMVMARAVVRHALQAASRPVHSAMDPAAGTGTFLVALAEHKINRIHGIEIDPVAAAVARVAVPTADVRIDNGFSAPGETDLLVGNPPFVPPERQEQALRDSLRVRLPWLSGRFDLAVPFAALSVDRVRPGGGVGLVLPAPMMIQPYARPLRARWLQAHRITHLSPNMAFPGAQVSVVCLAMRTEDGPAPIPAHGLPAEELLRMSAIPLQPALQPGDPDILRQVRGASIPLGEVATVDTGVVSHGIGGGKARLLHATATPGRVPYVDAKDLVANRTRWLDYQPEKMHRAKSPELFEAPKVLVQRLRGRGPIRAWVDRGGLYAGHTLTVVRPDSQDVSPELLHRLITDPLVDGLLRMERGSRLDLYPKDVRSIPLPKAWLDQPEQSLAEAWGLTKPQASRLLAFQFEVIGITG